MEDSCNRFLTLVPAAGSGERMLSHTRKPLLRLGSVPIIIHALSRLRAASGCGDIILAVHPADLSDVRAKYGDLLQNGLGVTRIIAGAGSRRQTVACMLEHADAHDGLILIHDGARPLVRPDTIEAAVGAAKNAAGGAIVAVPAQSTVKKVSRSGRVVSTPKRKELWMVQTPQVFWAGPLINSYKECEMHDWSVTDDAEVLERAGYEVVVVEGDCDNIKVTNPEDLRIAEVLLEYQNERGISVQLAGLC